jgi:hypothetical protein
MTEPQIIGRYDEDQTDARASTQHIHTVSVPCGGLGEVAVSIFRSTDNEDRGGIILRVTLKNNADLFYPFAENIPNGIDLHMAGDIEAESLVHALKTALSTI